MSGIVVFVDRFGSLYHQDKPFEYEKLVSVLKQEQIKNRTINVLYEPFSLEADRRELMEALKRDFPGNPVRERSAETSDGYHDRMLPLHSADVQSEILSQRNALWDQLLNHHQDLLDYVRIYLTSAGVQLAKLRSEMPTPAPATQHVTTRSHENASGN